MAPDRESVLTQLHALTSNYRWTWHPPTREVLARIPGLEGDPSPRSPLAVVAALTEGEWASLLADESWKVRLADTAADLAALHGTERSRPKVAYFSPEFGISEHLPQFSGGLGVLAGDHLKAASDAAIDLVGVGLFYREGFFRQELGDHGQVEHFDRFRPEELGLADTGLIVAVGLAGDPSTARVLVGWVGGVPVYLLDTDTSHQPEELDRISDRLYHGDREQRLIQEIVLGVGGARALSALGIRPDVYHLNEGHAGFMALHLLDHALTVGHSLAESVEALRPRVVFTTHTPVPAGIDRFSHDLLLRFVGPWLEGHDVDPAEFLALGRMPGDDPHVFNMAAFCLRLAGRSNGVSRLHGAVSRHMFAEVPGGPEITSVTNGVHARTWVAPSIQKVYDRTLGPGWDAGAPEAWSRASDIGDDELARMRRSARARLVDHVREVAPEARLDPDALTIGFARRFASYKRATLLLRDPERLAALLGDEDRPVQIVFAGKSHPDDHVGKALLSEVLAMARSPLPGGRLVLLPDYGMGVARLLVAGADVWLNTPIRGHEACGTSGEKSVLNGGLHCSVADGWWDEMHAPDLGWVIDSAPSGSGQAASRPSDADERDEERLTFEARALHDLLADQVRAEFYAEPTRGVHPWLTRVRRSLTVLGPLVTAARMVEEYRDRLYVPAAGDPAPLLETW